MKKFRRVRNVRSFLSLVLMALLFFSLTLPIEFCHAVGSPSFCSSRYYLMGLIEDGSTGAGLKGRSYEYAHLPTSEWTEMVADLQSGNHMLRAELFTLPGTPLPLTLQLTYNSANALVDVGVGKGWTTNLHAVVSEDSSTHDLTYVDATGAKIVFDWDSGNSKYVNPSGFAGKAEELQAGGYKITPLGSGSITFNSDGKLTEIAERCGTGKLEVGYTDGKPTTLTDDLSGREITLTWSSGKLTTVTDPMNHEWGLTIDGSNYLTELVKPGGTTVKALFEYDSTSSKMVSHTDFGGLEYGIIYHSSGLGAGRVSTWLQPTTPSAATTTFAYDTAQGYSQRTTLTDGESHDTDYFFGSSSYALEKVSQIEDSVELKTEIGYDSDGFMDSLKDSYGNETTLEYDAVKHLTSITYPPPATNEPSFVKEWVYDAATLAGKITQYKEKLTSSVWAETDYEYEDNDAPCKPSTITSPLNEETTIAYNSNGQVASVTMPTSASGFTTKTVSYTYDATTKSLTRMRNGEGNDVAYTNNSNGIPSTINYYQGTYDTGSLVGNIGKTFNAVGQVTATTSSVTNETTSATFTNNGSLATATSATDCEKTLQYTTTTGGNEYAAQEGVTALTPSKNYSEVILPGDPRYGNLVPLGSGGILPPSIASYRPNIFSSTNAQDHTTSYEYNNDGTLASTTNHLGQATTYSQDAFGRVDSVTNAFGKTTDYTFNRNSQLATKLEEGRGTVTYTYDNAGQLTSIIDPMRGTMTLDRSLNGSLSSDEMGDYSYDYSGRKTQLSYTGGGTDTWDYNQDGQLSGINEFEFTYDRSGNMDVWSDGTNDATFSYSGSEGSTMLGLPSSVDGTGNIGDYSYGYTSRHWLDALEDTSKTDQEYAYSYSSSKELTQLDYPNDQRLTQTFTSKKLDQIQVKKPADQEYLLSTNTTFNSNDEIAGYTSTVKESGSNTFTETNTLTYDQSHRLSTLAYASNSRTITFGYDAYNGRLTSKSYSDLNGSFGISYSSTTGNISSISYPAGLGGGNETFTYESSGRGRLTTITYPNQDTLTFSWSNKDQISELTFDDGTTVTSYSLTYNGMGKLSSYTKTEDSYEIETWNFTYGPHGLEYAEKVVNSEAVITQNFTTDPNSRILSMTYYEEDAAEGVNGEYYYHYDNFGNTAMLTDASGDRQYAALYDINNGKMVEEWNPKALAFEIKEEGEKKGITIELPGEKEITIKTCSIEYSSLLCSLSISSKITTIKDLIAKNLNKISSGCSSPCDGKIERTFLALGDWERIPIVWIPVPDEIDPIPVEIRPGLWMLIRRNVAAVEWKETLTEDAKNRLRADGYSEARVEEASSRMGDCFKSGGQKGNCEPYVCPDGTCGLKCFCQGENRTWTQLGDPICN